MISRRMFGMGVALVAGDGLVRPINAPPGQQTPVGVQPGQSNGVIRARLVIITGTGDGVFAYQAGTAPGLGNPPIAWLTGGGLVDPYGNILPSVMGVQGNGIFSSTGAAGQSTLAGNLLAMVPTGGASSAIFGAPSPGAAYIVSGTKPGTDSEAFLYLLSTLASGTFGAPLAILTGTLVASLPGGTATQPEVWHTPTLGTDYGYQSGAAKLSYRMTTANEVRINGVVTLSAGFANPLFTIPAAYRPPGLVGFPVGVFGAAVTTGEPYLSVTAAGAVQLTDVPAGAAAVVVSGSYPLDIPVDL